MSRGLAPGHVRSARADSAVSGRALARLFLARQLRRRPVQDLDDARQPLPPPHRNQRPAVVESPGPADRPRAAADVAEAVVAREHPPEVRLALETLADELPIARFEHVERDLLGRQENARQQKEAEWHGES